MGMLPRELAEQAVAMLAENGGSQTKAAKAMGLARTTFQARLETAARYGLMPIDPVMPAVNMAASGALKAAFREHMVRDISLAELEAIDMALTKLGRLATGKAKRDTYVDCAAYIAIAGEIGLSLQD